MNHLQATGIDCLVESTNSKIQTNSNSFGQLMGRSASERAGHLRFTNLLLMKNLKNFWVDKAKKHGNSTYLLCFYCY